MAIINRNIKSTDITNKLRIDPEYYLPNFVAAENKVTTSGEFSLLKHIAYITDGDHSTRKYTQHGIKFLTSENIEEFIIDYNTDRFISEDYEQTLLRSRAEIHSIYLSKTGRYYGKAAICVDEEIFNIPADVGKIRLYNYNKVDPFFLCAFLNTQVGNLLIRRENSGGTRDRITLVNIGKIPIPHIKDEQIKSEISNFINLKKRSQLLYQQATDLLNKELGLNDIVFEKKKSYTARFSEVVSNRMDAEFFNQELLNYYSFFKQSGKELIPITELTKVLKFSNPDYSKEGAPIITQRHLSSISPENYGDFPIASLEWLKKNPTAVIREDDLLFYSVGAYLGKTNIWFNEDQAVHASFITMLRCQNSFDAGYLMVLLNSKFGILQSKVYQSGSSQPYIYPKDIKQFLVPQINDELKMELYRLIKDSFNAKRESKRLLEQAKLRVEQLIEEAANKQ